MEPLIVMKTCSIFGGLQLTKTDTYLACKQRICIITVFSACLEPLNCDPFPSLTLKIGHGRSTESESTFMCNHVTSARIAFNSCVIGCSRLLKPLVSEPCCSSDAPEVSMVGH